jgi:hypothetical protein
MLPYTGNRGWTPGQDLSYSRDSNIDPACQMHPSLPSGLITCLTPSNGTADQLKTPTNSKFWAYANHFKLDVPLVTAEALLSYAKVKENLETRIAKWRLVSQGLHLSLINN